LSKRNEEGGRKDLYKQLIIARKDLNMSPGKLAAQVAHGSIAFLLNELRKNVTTQEYKTIFGKPQQVECRCVWLADEVYNNWVNESQTKVILGARNRNHLLKAKEIAESLGLEEGLDFNLIYDACRTELEPEEDNGSCLTVIGFRPLDSETADKIGKKYQLYH
jgi:PTH2 family peptidyl-tRNA hydrolase